MTAVGLVVLGYVLGSMPWGYWLPRLVAGVDIRTVGSGNTGATNVWRTLGFKLGLPVALLDIAKGLVLALLGRWLEGPSSRSPRGSPPWSAIGGLSFMRLSRGGKVVATTGGVGLAVAPFATLAAGGVWILVFLVTRYASVASIVGAAALPLFAILFGASTPVLGFTAGAAVAIVVLHRQNIARLFRGTENRFDLRRRALTRRPKPEASL